MATPLMNQYLEIKQRFSDALLFFRMGDFYELFFDDARVASSILEIALTTRNKNDPDPIPMCGVPHHAATSYINKLVSCGHKVAICEQLEDPATAKGIVKRDVVRVVTPGTQLDPEALDSSRHNLTHALKIKKDLVQWASCDYSTGRFWFGQCSWEAWVTYIKTSAVTEIVLPEDDQGHLTSNHITKEGISIYKQTVNSFYFDKDYAKQRILEQFETTTLSSIHPHLEESPDILSPIGALIKHFQETTGSRRIPLAHKLDRWDSGTVVELDYTTIQALELNSSQKNQGLFGLLNQTRTAMGARLLRSWMLRPLQDPRLIDERLDQVESFFSGRCLPAANSLQHIYDLERLLVRISTQGANARDLKNLVDSIERSSHLLASLIQCQAPRSLVESLRQSLNPNLISLATQVQNALAESLPLTVRDGGIFKKGYRSDLDELIDLSENGAQWLAQYESRERTQTGITSLKVRFNRVFGYYIEITKSNLGAVPQHYIRKQTTATGERYITEELKTFEEKILNSEKRRQDLEWSLFQELCHQLAAQSQWISELATAVSRIDAVYSLALVARDHQYTRPVVHAGSDIAITEGRHPTVELMGGFVSNNVHLSRDKRLMLITWPNMGGKSTVMRQTALIVLMAQMGSFVPATQARIGICDRIFTRIGANDNIAQGQSTFMVEMSEMSYILRNATPQSLVILDEVGRGTSTYDGLSLAWALAEELVVKTQARTMFATHYHEMTALSSRYPQAFNMRVGVQLHQGEDVRFLYRLEQGAAERSYGIYVAKLAGLPPSVLERAQAVLSHLEGTQSQPLAPRPTSERSPSTANKLSNQNPPFTARRPVNQLGFTFS